jgi:ribosomal protein S18 acetylase RimI-like enzyme
VGWFSQPAAPERNTRASADGWGTAGFAVRAKFGLAVGVRVLIRVAEPSDLELLSEALGPDHHAFFVGRLPLQKEGLGEILIAFRRSGPVGAVFISWTEADEPQVRKHLADVPMIFHLHVAPEHRHRGVGRTLLRRAEESLRLRGHTRVLLGVDKSNQVARALYEWLGYVRPHEPELSDLGATAEPGRPEHSVGEAYDILVADLNRPAPTWPEPG